MPILRTAVPYLLLTFTAVQLGCGDASDGGREVDARPADSSQSADATAPPDTAIDAGDAAGAGCAPTGLTEAQVTRKTDAAAVTVDAILLNALEGCPKDRLRFKLVLDTHSVALDAIDLPGSAVVETSLGGKVPGAARWTGGSESSHHRDGVLEVNAPSLVGVAWVRLSLRGIAGVDRSFEWDAGALGWTRR